MVALVCEDDALFAAAVWLAAALLAELADASAKPLLAASEVMSSTMIPVRCELSLSTCDASALPST